MAVLVGTVVLWLAAISRVVASIRRPDPARISMTVAAVCIAIAFTLTVSIAGAAFDDLVGWPNAGELVQHLFFAVATYATLRFLHLLRLGAIPRRSNVLQITVCAVVCLVMIGLFTAIPQREQTATNFTVEYADTLAAVAYRGVFYGYLVYCLVGIIVICRRNMCQATAAQRGSGVSHESTATAVSLAFIAAGAAMAILASAAGLSTMVVMHLTGQEVQLLVLLNAGGIALAALFAGIGVLAPVPVESFLRWRRARLTSAHLSPLWSGLTRAVPDVVLPVPATRSPVARAELASTRQRIEIADALHRVRIRHEHAAAIRHCADPPTALGHTLRDPAAWVATGSAGVIAADLLTEPKDSDLQQILTVAAAYGTS
jgi:hypothetical protein